MSRWIFSIVAMDDLLILFLWKILKIANLLVAFGTAGLCSSVTSVTFPTVTSDIFFVIKEKIKK